MGIIIEPPRHQKMESPMTYYVHRLGGKVTHLKITNSKYTNAHMTFAYDNVRNQIIIKKIIFYIGTRKEKGVFVVLLHLFAYHYVIYDDLYLHIYHRHVFLMVLISVTG